MADPILDAKLRRFLDAQEEAEAAGNSPKKIMETVRRIAEVQLTHEKADEVRHDEVINRVKGVEARVTDLEKSADSSGHHMREKLDSFNSDLDAVEQTVTSVKNAAETQIAALRATVEAEQKARRDAEQATKDAELAQLKAEKSARASATRSFAGKVATAVVTAVILSAGGGIIYLIQHAH